MAADPIFMSDGEVDPISHEPLPPPRVPRDRVLNTGEMYWLVVTVGLVVYGAGYLVWGWLRS